MSIETNVVDGILTITLARPEKKNALDLVMLDELCMALENGRSDKQVRVIVLRAEGGTFSAGGDIKVMREFADDAQATVVRLRGGLNRLVELLHSHPKPVIAAVTGNAYGAGAVLAFQCDLAIVARDAQFSLSFRHVGLIPDTGGTWLLPRIVGLQRAKHLIWTAAPFSGQDAVDWGLALRCEDARGVEAAAMQLAKALRDGPATTMAFAKHALHANLNASASEAVEREARVQGACFLTSEHREGRNAFFDRRRPNWNK